MGRNFYINQESLVKVKGGAHTSLFSSGNISATTELGLSSEPIKITINSYHKDINVDDFGPNVPADVMTHLATANIRIPFIHYDPYILDQCLDESFGTNPTAFFAGTLPPMGTLLGGWIPLFSSGCHYISLNIIPGANPPGSIFPWRFPSAYMTGPPMDIPLGTGASITITNWRAIPYKTPTDVILTTPVVVTSPGGSITGTTPGLAGIGKDINSSGVILFDRLIDT